MKTKHFPFEPKPHHLSVLFPKTDWISRGRTWVNLAPQVTKGWFLAREGRIPMKFINLENNRLDGCVRARLTGSKFGVAAGHAPKFFSTPEELARQIAGLEEAYFDEESLKRMNHGVQEEPNARRWYEMNHNVEVEEIGLVVPKWDFHLGASVDGIVKGTKGIIEIKCPKRMYKPLQDHLRLRETGWIPRPYYHSHIYSSQYDQMIGGMALLDKEWCDYIVYATEDGDVYQERISFNEEYWNNILYPKLQLFLFKELFPLLEEIIA